MHAPFAHFDIGLGAGLDTITCRLPYHQTASRRRQLP